MVKKKNEKDGKGAIWNPLLPATWKPPLAAMIFFSLFQCTLISTFFYIIFFLMCVCVCVMQVNVCVCVLRMLRSLN